ncbi:MAG: GDP-L-fucose synthase [Gemmatimonadetes bacterium]|nr:GDP-L-fucose synthase [Gemmatimonadota bacterium]
MSFWQSQRVIVTGGAGFLGSRVVAGLAGRDCGEVVVPRSRQYDLRREEDVVRLCEESRADMVIHLAATVGGIGANQASPGSFFYDNLMMGVQLMEQARRFGIAKFVAVGTICAYPANTPVPFAEEDLWNGYPEETNAPYGLAKKMLLVQARAYRQEYGTNAVYLLPTNLYGPGDNFDLASSHVIPAMIRKITEAEEAAEDRVVFWGDGTPTREFLFVEDAAEGILLAAEKFDGAEPVNLGSGREISIAALARLLCGMIGYRGEVVWDTSRPNGQLRRRVDTSRAARAFGFSASVGLEEGLRRTIDWYRSQPRG